MLRDTISPYMLRRMKKDVSRSLELPPKTEQVRFLCILDTMYLYLQFELILLLVQLCDFLPIRRKGIRLSIDVTS